MIFFIAVNISYSFIDITYSFIIFLEHQIIFIIYSFIILYYLFIYYLSWIPKYKLYEGRGFVCHYIPNAWNSASASFISKPLTNQWMMESLWSQQFHPV